MNVIVISYVALSITIQAIRTDLLTTIKESSDEDGFYRKNSQPGKKNEGKLTADLKLKKIKKKGISYCVFKKWTIFARQF